VRVEPGVSLEIPWTSEGPVLFLGPRGASVETIILVSEAWTLPIGRSGQGFLLPDLPQGSYRVLASGPDGPPPAALTATPPAPSGPGVLALVSGDGPLVGRIDVGAEGLDERVGTE
jgi:hypothetical protein